MVSSLVLLHFLSLLFEHGIYSGDHQASLGVDKPIINVVIAASSQCDSESDGQDDVALRPGVLHGLIAKLILFLILTLLLEISDLLGRHQVPQL
jgi:hypothetical protein